MGNQIRGLIEATTIITRMQTVFWLVSTMLFSLAIGKTYLVETIDKNPTHSPVHPVESIQVVIPEANDGDDTTEANNDVYTHEASETDDSAAAADYIRPLPPLKIFS